MANFKFNSAQLSKARKGVTSLTHTLNQTLKSFRGIYSQAVYIDNVAYTLEHIMDDLGLLRPVKKDGKKGDYDFKSVQEAWAPELLVSEEIDGKKTLHFMYFKGGAVRTKDGYKVYTKEQAEIVVNGGKGKEIRYFKKVAIPVDAWSADILMRGLEHSRDFVKHQEKSNKLRKEFNGYASVWIVKEVQGEGGSFKRVMEEIRKDDFAAHEIEF